MRKINEINERITTLSNEKSYCGQINGLIRVTGGLLAYRFATTGESIWTVLGTLGAVGLSEVLTYYGQKRNDAELLILQDEKLEQHRLKLK